MTGPRWFPPNFIDFTFNSMWKSVPLAPSLPPKHQPEVHIRCLCIWQWNKHAAGLHLCRRPGPACVCKPLIHDHAQIFDCTSKGLNMWGVRLGAFRGLSSAGICLGGHEVGQSNEQNKGNQWLLQKFGIFYASQLSGSLGQDWLVTAQRLSQVAPFWVFASLADQVHWNQQWGRNVRIVEEQEKTWLNRREIVPYCNNI